jgi:hypothetical protein
MLDKVAEAGKSDYQNILDTLKKGEVIYADETGWRESGINGYWWNLSNQDLQFLVYRKSRGAKVVAELLGEDGKDFEGTLITDFYTAYNEYAGYHQRCWVHYLRDVEQLELINPEDKQLKRWSKKVKGIYEEAKSYAGPDPNLLPGLKERERVEKERYFRQKLRQVCEPYLKTDLPQSKLSARALRFMSEMFIFIRLPNISSDNNKAERDIRHLVVARKISGGTKSEKGSETKSILASLFGTWDLQELNPLEQCKQLLIQYSLSQL